jgi:hypothetical protein
VTEGPDDGKDLLKAGMAAAEAGQYRRGYDLLGKYYGSGLDGVPPDGLSHFGLCVAVVERQTRKGVELCQAAINAQFYQTVHYANLVKLYIERDDRRNAVKTLQQGLRRMPGDARLRALRDTIGYRRKPPIPFLSRDNVLNVFLGKIRSSLGKGATTPASRTPGGSGRNE